MHVYVIVRVLVHSWAFIYIYENLYDVAPLGYISGTCENQISYCHEYFKLIIRRRILPFTYIHISTYLCMCAVQELIQKFGEFNQWEQKYSIMYFWFLQILAICWRLWITLYTESRHWQLLMSLRNTVYNEVLLKLFKNSLCLYTCLDTYIHGTVRFLLFLVLSVDCLSVIFIRVNNNIENQNIY